MADFAAVATLAPHGLNEKNREVCTHIVGQATAAADTLTFAVPADLDKSFVPTYAVASRVNNNMQPMTLTSFDRTTGVLVLTVPAGGALAAGDLVIIEFRGVLAS